MQESYRYLSEAQLKSAMARCEYCEEKPCQEACPSHCSPADFIRAAMGGQPQDYVRAARSILEFNPLGQVCGVVCPDTFCMAACSRKKFDAPVEIPKIQAAILHHARQQSSVPLPAAAPLNGKKIAIVGAGPAGLAAAAWLARAGYAIELYDEAHHLGGACRQIPDFRFPKPALEQDVDFILRLGAIAPRLGQRVTDPEALLREGCHAVLVATGTPADERLGVAGDDLTVTSVDFLLHPDRYQAARRVAVVGGGAVAADCATTARRRGATAEMFVRRTLAEMPLTRLERDMLIDHGVDITTRTRIQSIAQAADGTLTLQTTRVEPGGTNPRDLADLPGTSVPRAGFDTVVMALGSSWRASQGPNPAVFFAGDSLHGGTTVVESVASGKNAAMEIDRFLRADRAPAAPLKPGPCSKVKSRSGVGGLDDLPVDLSTDFFGRRIASPFLLSAAPHTDGFEQMKAAYEHGWVGGVMKTAFDGVPIHIPAAYMFALTDKTYGNADNVSGHYLDRVCVEIERLRKLYPDRLTMGSTGGPVTGHDEADCRVWQSNSRKLEQAGALGVEFSLSCPQGGDGTEGDIVSQNAAVTAKVIDWVMQSSDPDIPKLFKLTAAVTSIKPVMKAVSEVLARYPGKKAGVTLANSFPVLGFRPRREALGHRWDEGVVLGMSGEGVVPISYLTLAQAAPFGVPISGNGGVMDYRAAANFLALGARSVQVCTVVMRYGLGIIRELDSGLSYLLAARGFQSVADLIGCATPCSVTPFPQLTAVKQVSQVLPEVCQSCGNCVRGCGYQALTLNADGVPTTDPSKCIGCTICSQACFAGALFMRDRSEAERLALCEQ